MRPIFATSKITHSKFFSFYEEKNKRSYINCRAFQTASNGIFCFLIQRINGWKKWNGKCVHLIQPVLRRTNDKETSLI